MNQNKKIKKKGIAKKAISVSLVAAMLATTNLPVWADTSTGTDIIIDEQIPEVIGSEESTISDVQPYGISDQAAPNVQAGSSISGNPVVSAMATYKDTIKPDYTNIQTDPGVTLTYQWMYRTKDADGVWKAWQDAGAASVDAKNFDVDDVKYVGAQLKVIVYDEAGDLSGGKESATIDVQAKTIETENISVKLTSAGKSKAYDEGKAITLAATDFEGTSGDKAVSVSYKDTAGADQTVDIPFSQIKIAGYENNTEIGTARFTIELLPELCGFSGTKDGEFSITGSDSANLTVNVTLPDGVTTKEYTYTGSPIVPDDLDVKVVDSAKNYTLVKGTDYDIAPIGPDAGSAQVLTINGKNGYGGMTKSTTENVVQVVAKSITSSDIQVTGLKESYPADAAEADILETLKVRDTATGKELIKGTDFILKLKNSTLVGFTATVELAGDGNYKDTLKKTYTVAEKDMQQIDVAAFGTSLETLSKTYNGKAQVPFETGDEFSYTPTGGSLTKLIVGYDFDYTVLSGGTNAGPATIKITGKNGYSGSFTTTKWEIKKLHLTSDAGLLKIAPDKLTFDPTKLGDDEVTPDYSKYAPKLAVQIKDTGYTLVEGKDYYIKPYTVAGNAITINVTSDEVKNAAGRVVFAAAENFTNDLAAQTVTVGAKDFKDTDVQVAPIEDQPFTGKYLEPEVTVTYKGVKLKKDTDYTVSYADNRALGTNTAKATIKATSAATTANKYTGEKTVTFSIVGATLDKGSIVNTTDHKADLPAVAYNEAAAATPEGIILPVGQFEVRDANNKVVSSNYYDVTYRNNKAVGTATITVTGKNGYKGSLSSTYKIASKALPTDSFTLTSANLVKSYTGSEVTLVKDMDYTITGSIAQLTEGKDYTLKYKNNTAVGTATVMVQGINNYFGEIERTFKITKAVITGADISMTNTAYAAGQPVKPEVVIHIPGGSNTLTEGTDYTLSYTNVSEVGEVGTVTIKYNTDDKVAPVNVDAAKSVSVATFTVTAKDMKDLTIDPISDQTYTGKAVEPLLTVKNGNVVLAKDTDYTVTYKDNTAVGTATATIAPVAGSTRYTGSKDITFKIVADKPATPVLVLGNNTTTGIKLAWNAVEGATGYVVYGYNKADMKTIVDRKIVKGTSVTLTYTPGTSKSFVVRAYKTVDGKNVYSGISNKVVTATKPNKTDIKSITAGKGIAKVYTTVGKGAIGAAYCVSYDGGKTYKIVAKGPKGVVGSNNYIMKGLKKGSAIIKIRGYVKDHAGKTVYGDWSKAVKVTIK